MDYKTLTSLGHEDHGGTLHGLSDPGAHSQRHSPDRCHHSISEHQCIKNVDAGEKVTAVFSLGRELSELTGHCRTRNRTVVAPDKKASWETSRRWTPSLAMFRWELDDLLPPASCHSQAQLVRGRREIHEAIDALLQSLDTKI